MEDDHNTPPVFGVTEAQTHKSSCAATSLGIYC